MTDKELYRETLDNRIQDIISKMAAKNEEYASDENPYYNFSVGARKLGSTPEAYLWNLNTKHIVSIQDMVYGGTTTEDLVNEKIGDAIIYLILLDGLLKKRMMKT